MAQTNPTSAIRRELAALYDSATLAATTPVLFTRENAIETAQDRIIEIVREAMLSDEAVDEMLQRSFGWLDYDKGLTFKDMPEEEKGEWRDETRHELLGAIETAFGADDEGE